MEALLHNDDRPFCLIVKPGIEDLLVVFSDTPSLGFGMRIASFHGVIDNDEIRTEAGDSATDGHRLADAPPGRLGFKCRVPLVVDLHAGKQPSVKGRLHDTPKI